MNFFKVLNLLGFPVKEASVKFKEIKSATQQADWLEQQRWRIFDYHYNNNQAYRNFIGEYPASWEDVPVINKSIIREQGIPVIPDNNQYPKYYSKRTSGSTGNPFLFKTDYLTHTLTWYLLSDRYLSTGVSLNDLQARFYGIPLSLKSRLIERFKDRISNRYRFDTYNLSDENIEAWLKLFSSKRFKYIYGYSYPIITLSKYLAKKNLKLKTFCPGLTSCIVTSEMCSSEEQLLIEETFGVPVYNEYGSSEVGVIGFGRNNKWLLSDELVYTEIIDDAGKSCPNGVVGNVIITSLFNRGTPFVKYDIGDLAAIENFDNKRYLVNLQGRIEECAILKSGKKVAGDSVFYYVFKEFTSHCHKINEYTVNQLSPSVFEIKISVKEPLLDKEIENLKKTSLSFLEPDLEIRVIQQDLLERTPMGKFKRFTRKFSMSEPEETTPQK